MTTVIARDPPPEQTMTVSRPSASLTGMNPVGTSRRSSIAATTISAAVGPWSRIRRRIPVTRPPYAPEPHLSFTNRNDMAGSSARAQNAGMHTRLIPLLALAACTQTPGPQPASPAPDARYGAVGTEPFWSLGLADGRIAYADAAGRTIEVAAPPARPSFNGERYVTARLTLDITHAPCSDGMSDRTYPDTVRVIADGRELKGCGESRPDNALEARDWQVSAIGGEAPGGPRPATLRFEGGRLTGTTGCNRLTARYTLAGTRLRIEGAATTRMACPAPAMAQEQRLTTALRGPLTLVQGKDGVMLAHADGSAAVTLVPVRP